MLGTFLGFIIFCLFSDERKADDHQLQAAHSVTGSAHAQLRPVHVCMCTLATTIVLLIKANIYWNLYGLWNYEPYFMFPILCYGHEGSKKLMSLRDKGERGAERGTNPHYVLCPCLVSALNSFQYDQATRLNHDSARPSMLHILGGTATSFLRLSNFRWDNQGNQHRYSNKTISW